MFWLTYSFNVLTNLISLVIINYFWLLDTVNCFSAEAVSQLIFFFVWLNTIIGHFYKFSFFNQIYGNSLVLASKDWWQISNFSIFCHFKLWGLDDRPLRRTCDVTLFSDILLTKTCCWIKQWVNICVKWRCEFRYYAILCLNTLPSAWLPQRPFCGPPSFCTAPLCLAGQTFAAFLPHAALQWQLPPDLSPP